MAKTPATEVRAMDAIRKRGGLTCYRRMDGSVVVGARGVTLAALERMESRGDLECLRVTDIVGTHWWLFGTPGLVKIHPAQVGLCKYLGHV